MNTPLVTIVIPVYNGADYLGEAIESALAQTYPAIEVLVVDDGSSDGGATVEVMRRFGSRIRCLHKPNGGVATALNRGIEAMRGSLFSWLSHDDLYTPAKIERQVAAMLDFKAPCIVAGDYEEMGAKGEPLSKHSAVGWNLVARPLDAVFHGLINGCALLIPRYLFRAVGLFEPGLPTTQDYELWYRMARVVPFVPCRHVGVRQRIHPLQGSRQASHRDEAGRMFANLIDRTPPDIMRAYDGTELRFLLRTRRSLAPYPAADGYLTFRIGAMLRDIRVMGLTLGTTDGDTAATVLCRRLQALSAGAGASPDDLVQVRISDDTTPEILRQAIETLILQDADIVVPSDPPSLDGLLMRLGAAAALAASLTPRGTIDWVRLAEAIRVERYETVSVPVAAPALPSGEGGKKDHDSLQPGTSSGLFEGEGPVILFLADPANLTARTHLDRLVAALSGRVGCLVAHAHADGRVTMADPRKGAGERLAFQLPAQAPEFRAAMRRLGVVRIDVQHTAGLGASADAVLAAAARPFDLTLLDPTPFEEVLSSCRHGAQRVIAFSHATAARVGRLSPETPVVHTACWAVPRQHVFRPRLWRGEPLRVLLLGRIGEDQGRQTVIDTAARLRARALPVRVHLFGSMALSESDAGAIGEDVMVDHGPVAPDRLVEVVSGAAPHIAWLPGQQPDAWNHALSAVMDLGLPLAASDAVGISERCQGRPHTWLFPSDSGPELWVRHFLHLHASGLETPARWGDGAPVPPPPRGFFFERYLAPVLEPP